MKSHRFLITMSVFTLLMPLVGAQATEKLPGLAADSAANVMVNGGIRGAGQMAAGGRVNATMGHLVDTKTNVNADEFLLQQRDWQVSDLYISEFPKEEALADGGSNFMALNGGGCGINLNVIPAPFRQLLLNECVSDVMQEKPGSKSYCDCVKKRYASYASNASGTGAASRKSDLDMKKALQRKNLEADAVRHLLKEWRDSFQRVYMAQNQAMRIVDESKADMYLPAASCSIGNVIKKLDEARSKPGCNKETFDRFASVAKYMKGNRVFGLISSIAQDQGVPTETSMAGLKEFVAAGNDLNNATPSAAGSTGSGGLSLNCFPNGEDRVLGSMGLTVGATQKNRKQSTDLIDEMISSLKLRLSMLEAGQEKIMNDFDTDEVRHRSPRPGDEAYVRAIENFPTLGFLIKGLASGSEVKPTPEGTRSLVGASDEILNARRAELKDQIKKLISSYEKIREGLLDEDLAPLDRVKLAYGEIKKFNAQLKSPLERVAKPEYDFLSTVHCGQMSNDLIRLACAPVIPLGEIGFVDAVLENSWTTPSPKDCNTLASNANPDKCLIVQSITCDYADKARDTKTNVFASLETMKNYQGEWGVSPNSQRAANNRAELARSLCGGYSAWVMNEACKGKDLSVCIGSPEASIERYTKEHPDDKLADVVTASNAAQGGSVDFANEGGEKMRDDSTNSIVEGMKQGSSFDNVAASVDATSPGMGFGEIFKTTGQQLASGITTSMGGTSGRSNILGNTAIPFLPSEGLRQQVAAKDEEIREKEAEASDKRTQIATTTDSGQKSELQKQLDDLQRELATLRGDRERLERERVAAKEKEEQEAIAEDDEPTTRQTRRKARRTPASTTSDDSDVVSTTTGGTGGGSTTGPVATGGGGAGSVGGGFSGGGASAPRFSTVQQAVSAPSSQALLEANQLKLTVNGSEVPAQDVVTLQVPAGATPDVIRRLIEDNRDKLKFVNDLAMVELIGPGNKPVYYQVKKQGEGFELVAVKENIPQQVRGWSASYQNLMQRLRQSTTRGPASPSN